MRVNINDGSFVIGQDHPRALLSDADVDLIRDLHEDFGFSYMKLAWVFSRLRKVKVSKHYIRDICVYRRRIQIATGSKEKPE